MHIVWVNVGSTTTQYWVTNETTRVLELRKQIQLGTTNITAYSEFFTVMFDIVETFGSDTVFQLFGSIGYFFRSNLFTDVVVAACRSNGWVDFPLQRHILRRVRDTLVLSLDALSSGILNIRVRIRGGADMPWESISSSWSRILCDQQNCPVADIGGASVRVRFPNGTLKKYNLVSNDYVECPEKFVQQLQALHLPEHCLLYMTGEFRERVGENVMLDFLKKYKIQQRFAYLDKAKELLYETQDFCNTYKYTVRS